MKKSTRIGKLIYRYTRNELSREEELELTAWRNESPERERRFREETDPQNIRAAISRMYNSQDAVWEKIKARNPIPQSSPEPIKEMQKRSRFPRAAAVLIPFLGLVLYFATYDRQRKRATYHKQELEANLTLAGKVYQQLDDAHRGFLSGNAGIHQHPDKNGEWVYVAARRTDFPTDLYYHLYSPEKMKFSLLFNDGAQIWLNTDTHIFYPANSARDTMDIYIDGEAYVETAPNTKTHYMIHSSEMQIHLTQGQLNIWTSPGDKETIVTVLSGMAKILPSKTFYFMMPELQLSSGQQITAVGSILSVSPAVDTNAVTDWRKHYMGL